MINKICATGLLLVCFFSVFVFAKKETNKELYKSVTANLPQKLLFIQPGKTNKKEIIAKLGKPPKADKTNYFYQLNDIKYDTTISFKNEKVEYLFYEPGSINYNFHSVKNYINEEIIKKSVVIPRPNLDAHEAGRTFVVVIPNDGLKLTFKNNERKNLKSILIWKPGEKLP